MEPSKLQVNLPQEFFDVLEELLVKIKIISSLPLEPDEYDEVKDLDCFPVIDLTFFKPCNDKVVRAFLDTKSIKGKCDEVCNVLESLKTELTEKGMFETLINYVEDFCGKYLKDIEIMEDYNKNVMALNKIKKDLIEFKKAKLQMKRELDNQVYKSAFNFYKTQHEVISETKFTSKWIDARVRQKELLSSQKVDKINQNSRKIEIMSLKEWTCGRAIEQFYTFKIKQLNDEASNISALYDKKMEELELRFQIAKNERRDTKAMAENEKQIFMSRQKQIDDYIAHKAKVAADKILRELQEAKSIKIQAWWRGVMVRCYLGSFKKFKKRARKIRQEMRAAKSQKNKNRKK